MIIYAIGDLHGQVKEMQKLLKRIEANGDCEQIWLTGDLINRGPDSAGCLRLVKSLGSFCVTVLGNHDLSMLAAAHGYIKLSQRNNDFPKILTAPDKIELIDWLQTRPLIHTDNGYTIVHAGIAPQWSIDEAHRQAKLVEDLLASEKGGDFLGKKMFGDIPLNMNNKLSLDDQCRYIINALTRMRFLAENGDLELITKTSPKDAKNHLTPWYNFPGRRTVNDKIIFGHWAAMSQNDITSDNIFHIDTGCVWGGSLSAIRIDTSCHNSSRFEEVC